MWTPGVLCLSLAHPPPTSTVSWGPGGQGLTCPVVQEADASVVMGGDGEGLVWVAHHLVDLGWAWKGKQGGGTSGGNWGTRTKARGGPFCHIPVCLEEEGGAPRPRPSQASVSSAQRAQGLSWSGQEG